jgi:hypothetical protein
MPPNHQGEPNASSAATPPSPASSPSCWVNGAGSTFVDGGWVAYFYTDANASLVIQINSNPASNIVNYGDGQVLVVGTEEAGCTFTYSKNDSGGLKGTIDCPTTVASNVTSGARMHIAFQGEVDAHT